MERSKDDYQVYLESENYSIEFKDRSGCLNQLFYLYLNKILNFGKKTKYEFNNLFRVNSRFTHAEIDAKVEKYLQNRDKKKFPNFYEFLQDLTSADFKIGTFIMILPYILQIALPFVVKFYLEWLKDEDTDNWKGYALGVALAFISLSKPLFTQQSIVYLWNTRVIAEMGTRVFFPL
jgi:hypothetical protein